MCLPKKGSENLFEESYKQSSFARDDGAQMNIFNNLDAFVYERDDKISLKLITTENELKVLDEIITTAFKKPIGLIFKFLRAALPHPDITLFLAYYNNKPVGCCMLAFIGNVPGLYWDSVLPENRRLGIGTENVEVGERWGKISAVG